MWMGLEMALSGMGTVFTFLILLIFLTSLMSKIVGYFEHADYKKEGVQSVHANAHSVHRLNNAMSDEVLIKVITAAIQQHRSAHDNYE